MHPSLAKFIAVSLVAGVACFATGPVRAGFTVTLDGSAPSGSDVRYSYGASISNGETIVEGDFFRIYDFYGYVPGSISAPAGWTATVESVSSVQSPAVILSYGDDAAVSNLVFTYHGTSPIVGATTITGFSAVSVFAEASRLQNYAGLSTAGQSGLGKIGAVGSVQVPGIGIPNPAAAPEPSAIASMAVGLVAVAWGYRRRAARHASA